MSSFFFFFNGGEDVKMCYFHRDTVYSPKNNRLFACFVTYLLKHRKLRSQNKSGGDEVISSLFVVIFCLKRPSLIQIHSHYSYHCHCCFSPRVCVCVLYLELLLTMYFHELYFGRCSAGRPRPGSASPGRCVPVVRIWAGCSLQSINQSLI